MPKKNAGAGASILTPALAAAAAQAKKEGLPAELQRELMEMLEDHNMAQRMLDNTGINFERFGQERSKEELLSLHKQTLNKYKTEIMQTNYQLNISSHRDVKPASDFPSPPPLETLLPIRIRFLQLGVTHKGRVLRGRLLPEAPVVFTGLQELVEDEDGNAIRVSMYNLIPNFENGMERQMYAEKMFKKGRPIAIIEPYFKVFADGTQGIRVDNPAEVVWLDSLSPMTADGWQKEGGRHYAANQHCEALGCYAEALRVLPGGGDGNKEASKFRKANNGSPAQISEPVEPGLLMGLLLNISACALQLGDPKGALQYAVAAAAVAPSASKPFFRAALALEALGHEDAAEWSMLESACLVASFALAETAPGLTGVDKAAMEAAAKEQIAETAAQVAAQLLPHLSRHREGGARGGAAGHPGTSGQPRAKQLLERHLCAKPAVATEARLRMLRELAAAQGMPPPGSRWAGADEADPPPSASTSSSGQGQGGQVEGKGSKPAGSEASQEARAARQQHGAPQPSGSQALRAATAAATDAADADAAAAARQAAHIKEEGNQLYRAQQPLGAVRRYIAALALLAPRPAMLLSNRAACFLCLGERQQALQAAASAWLLAPSVKAAFRCTTALLGLQLLPEAGEACKQALALYPNEPSLLDLQQRIATAAASVPAGTPPLAAAAAAASGKKQRQKQQQRREGKQLTERELADMRKQESMNVAEMQMLNNMLSLLPPEMTAEAEKKFGMRTCIDSRIPPFHEELLKSGELPALCNKESCLNYLWNGYEAARGMSIHQVMLLTPHKDAWSAVNEIDLLQRLQDTSEKRLAWLSSPGVPMGHVSFLDSASYASNRVHSYGNVPAIAGQPNLRPGTTHVAVGFVDLGSLAAGVAGWECGQQQQQQQQQPRQQEGGETGGRGEGGGGAKGGSGGAGASSREGGESSSSSGGSGGNAGGSRVHTKPAAPVALRWVGFEASPACVAQALVTVQMLRMGADVDHVLQVWVSAAWSWATLVAFRAALTAVLATAATGNAHFNGSSSSSSSSTTPIPTAEVEQPTWAQALPQPVQRVLHFWQLHDLPLEEARQLWMDNTDKIKACIANFVRKRDRIALSKYLVSSEVLQGDIGSLTMFASSYPRGVVERSFNESFLQIIPFCELVLRMETQGLDPVQAAVEVLRARLAKLAQLVQQGRVDIQLRLGAVTPDNKPLLDHIACLRPRTMSWSNVPDYVTPPSRFHAMAAACSAPNTIHFMHSMNWPVTVKGACFMDFQIADPKGAPKVLERFLEDGKQEIQRAYNALGIKSLLCPPVDNAKNVVDVPLYMRYYKDWVRAFFNEGRRQGLKDIAKQVKVEPPVYSILSRANSTLHICFTYGQDGV